MITKMHSISIVEISKRTGVSEETLSNYIERNWISPTIENGHERKFDEEDLARIQLILDLTRDFGVNDESIPIILHLVDQIHFLRNRFRDHLA